jgi:hypothetical protein
MADPVSWLQIEQGWNVLASDGSSVGTVAQVEGDKQADIFDGLAVECGEPKQVRYVAGEQVGAITPGVVMLKVGPAAAFPLFEAAPPETTWRPGKPSLGARLTNLLRGKR